MTSSESISNPLMRGLTLLKSLLNSMFFQSNPGMRSRIAHHVDFPDYGADELLSIAERMLDSAGREVTDKGATLTLDELRGRVKGDR